MFSAERQLTLAAEARKGDQDHVGFAEQKLRLLRCQQKAEWMQASSPEIIG